MRTIIVGATAALVLAVAGALVLRTAKHRAGVTLQLARGTQLVGLYAPPNGRVLGRVYSLSPGKLLVTAKPQEQRDWSYNLAVFDLQSFSYTQTFSFVPDAADEHTGNGIAAVACAQHSPRIAMAYYHAGSAGVGNVTTGELELELEFNPYGYVTTGMVGEHEIAVAYGKYSAMVGVFDLDVPALLATIQLPSNYEPDLDWENERSADYDNCPYSEGQLVHSDTCLTTFIPFGWLGVVQWIRFDLTGGFSYETGAIDVGGNPRWLTLSGDGEILYSLDDQNNVLKIIDLSTLSVVDTIDIPSGTIVRGVLDSVGLIFLSLQQDIPREFCLTRVNPVNHEVASSETEGGFSFGPEIYNGSLYVIRTEMGSEVADLLEFNAGTLAVTNETNLGVNALGFMIDPSTGYGASMEWGGAGRLILLSL